jgi:hypothetical protein
LIIVAIHDTAAAITAMQTTMARKSPDHGAILFCISLESIFLFCCWIPKATTAGICYEPRDDFLMKQASEKRNAIIDITWLVLLIAATSFWCVRIASFQSATFDEPTYLKDGLSCWHTGSYKSLLKLGTMPLPVDVETLPLYLWERAHGTAIDMNRDFDWALALARATALVFWALLLVYVFRIARSIGGSWAGRIASAMVGCEPSMLAHAALATTDIAITAMLMMFAYEFQAGRGKGWLRRIGMPSVLYGLAILAKVSGLVFAPLFMLVIECHRLWRSEEFRKIARADLKIRFRFFRDGLWAFRRDFLWIIGLGLLVTFLYCRSDWGTEPTFITWAQGLAPGALHNTMLWIAEHLRIFTNAGEGIAQQIKHNMRGHPSYILGETHRRAVWYYFPVTLSIKCSIPFLLTPVVIALFRRRALLNWPLLAALALLAYSVTCRVQIGIRFMLPLLALAAAGYGPAIVQAVREARQSWQRIALVVFIGAGVLYTAVASFIAGPDALCYTNEFWGGTENGYLYLSDSNYDWGQGLKDLLVWRQLHKVDVVDLCYFGADPRRWDAPFRILPFIDPAFVQGRPWEEVFRGKCVAVSTTLLYGPYLNAQGLDAVAYLKQHKPVDRTMTFFIYDFRPGPQDSQ